MKLIEKMAEDYYWAHTNLHVASVEQSWLKDIVMACFEDGFRAAREMAAAIEYRGSGVSEQYYELRLLGEEEVG